MMFEDSMDSEEIELTEEALEGVSGGKIVIKMTSDLVKVHAAPNSGSNVVGTLKKGDHFHYGEKQNDSHGVKWYKVKCNGQDGWVCAKDCRLAKTR